MKTFEDTSVTIKVNGLEMVCLEKLSLVSHALVTKLDYRAAEELRTLVGVLDDVVRRVKLSTETK